MSNETCQVDSLRPHVWRTEEEVMDAPIRMALVCCACDSTGSIRHQLLKVDDVKAFYNNILAQLLEPGEYNVSWNCYNASKVAFGTEDLYWLASSRLHMVDDGSSFGRVGFCEKAEVLAIIFELQALLRKLDRRDLNWVALINANTFEVLDMDWNFPDDFYDFT